MIYRGINAGIMRMLWAVPADREVPGACNLARADAFLCCTGGSRRRLSRIYTSRFLAIKERNGLAYTAAGG